MGYAFYDSAKRTVILHKSCTDLDVALQRQCGHVSVLSVFIGLQIRRRHLPDGVGGHHQAQSVRAGGAGNCGERRHGAASGTQSALGLPHIAQVRYGRRVD